MRVVPPIAPRTVLRPVAAANDHMIACDGKPAWKDLVHSLGQTDRCLDTVATGEQAASAAIQNVKRSIAKDDVM